MNRSAFALTLGAIAGILAAMQPLSDTDMWWHLATGRETIASGIVRTDVFSWTVTGAPVSTDQWLGQVVMWLSYVAFGWHGVGMLRVALVVALVAVIAWSAMRSASRPLAIVLGTMPALLLTRAVWVDRPELIGLVLFAMLLLLLRRLRDETSSTVVAIVGVIGLWSNIHGSFALGVVLTVLVCFEAALRDPTRRGRYLACASGALAVTLLTPAGVGVWTAPGAHFLSPPRDIQEWNVIDVRTPLGVAYVVTLAAFIACVFLGPRVPARDIVIVVPVAILSLTAARQAPLLAIAAAPLFADRAEMLLDRLRLSRPQRSRPFPTLLAAAVPLLTIYLALFLAPRDATPPTHPLASIPLGDKVLARYELGGWLIWSGVPVFVDGRLTPYSGAVLDDYRRIIAAGPGWQDAVARRGVRMLMVAPSDPVATRALELGWMLRSRSNDVIVIAVP